MKKFLLTPILFLIPNFVHAGWLEIIFEIIIPGYSRQSVEGIDRIILILLSIVYSIIPILIGLAVLAFIWGLIKYIKNNSDQDKKDAVGVMTFGIVALFVIVSVWGLVAVLQGTFIGGGIINDPNITEIEVRF